NQFHILLFMLKRLLNRLLCLILFHRLCVVHTCSRTTRHVMCLRCGRHFGMHDGLRIFIPRSDELCLCQAVEEFIEAYEKRAASSTDLTFNSENSAGRSPIDRGRISALSSRPVSSERSALPILQLQRG